METTLMMALLVVASDQGNLLLRKSLIRPFPIPNTNEYIKHTTRLIMKFSSVFSSVNPKKKIIEVTNEIQHNVIRFFRFIFGFLISKIGYIAGTKNYFFPNGCFLWLNGIKKPSAIKGFKVYFGIISQHRLKSTAFGLHLLCLYFKSYQ